MFVWYIPSKLIYSFWGRLDGISTICTMSVYPSCVSHVMTLLVCRIINMLGLYALCMFIHWVQFILSHEVIFKCDEVCNQLRTPWTCFKWLGLNLIVTSTLSFPHDTFLPYECANLLYFVSCVCLYLYIYASALLVYF